MSNLFAGLPSAPQTSLPEEIVEVLAEGTHVRIERIVSTGQASPPGFWYDQDEHEWVLLLTGEAGLWIAGEDQPRVMQPGDYLNIPAHQKHRVEWTAPNKPTLWLAVCYSNPPAATH
ncbi:cupin domain-containing protein [Candidatus Laterigemmans baculatus]|uniref:cupin domain-containing protein n=1 Tax=Candidatus Laterigemmans baculatus TaxID=2770505 RepID=UPI0013DA9843|nr:cupin domain-containing protein [Candidatus Laterigemmans baculatus]